MGAFAKKVQKIMGSAVAETIPRGEWRGVRYEHIFLDLKSNFIDGRAPEKCSIKGDMTDKYIKYHKGARHMNSSQVMCISFFKKFFEKPEYERVLLDVLKKSGVEIAPDEKIKAAVFEYEPYAKERTNFDFYMVLLSGERISFEVKYTEPDFGGVSPDKDDPHKYDRKWDNIYKDMVLRSPFLDVCKEAFYKNYQINRNIVYAAANDHVLFLTPRANDEKGIAEGRCYIDQLHCHNIKNLYWEDISEKTLEAAVKYRELSEYYLKFFDKYIKFLI